MLNIFVAGVPFGLDCRCCGSEELWASDPKLITRVINFELVQPICPGYIDVRDGRTDGRLTIAIPRPLALQCIYVHRAVKMLHLPCVRTLCRRTLSGGSWNIFFDDDKHHTAPIWRSCGFGDLYVPVRTTARLSDLLNYRSAWKPQITANHRKSTANHRKSA